MTKFLDEEGLKVLWKRIKADHTSNSDKINAAINKANALATVIDSKADQSAVNTLAGGLTEVNRAVDTNRSAINTVKESVATNKQNITNLTSQLQTTNTNLTNFKALKGAANGLATLDAQGHISLDQLANLDTTVYKVLGQNDALPTTNIKSCIYLKLIESGNPTGNNNKYAEYVYTGNITGIYDATKWEKLGEVTASVDLSGYYTKGEIDTKIYDIEENALGSANISVSTTSSDIFINSMSIDTSYSQDYPIPIVTTTDTEYVGGHNGLMSPTMLTKLNSLNNYTHPVRNAAASAEEGLYKITVDALGHVSKTTAVTKEDITKLGISGSASTVDTAMSDTSTNAVQNKVIDNAIRTHKVNENNFSEIDDLNSSHTNLLFYSNDEFGTAVNYIDRYNHCYSIFDVDDSNGVPKIAYSQDGGLSPMSYLLTDLDVVALSETEVNDILNAPI